MTSISVPSSSFVPGSPVAETSGIASRRVSRALLASGECEEVKETGVTFPFATPEGSPRKPRTRRNRKRLSVEERFWSKVDKNGPVPECAPQLGPCWVWTGGTDQHGYGQIVVNDVRFRAHVLLHGKAGDGLEWDHLCRVQGCVGPTEGPPHLEAVTHKVNIERAVGTPWQIQAALTHCKRGHEFTPENTRVETTGSRRCRACDAARGRRRNPGRRDYYREYQRAWRARQRVPA